MLREDDGVYICSRCGLVNPTNDVPCIPVEVNPSAEDLLRLKPDD
jgi:hypothetical protein